ncbi:RNA polymerase sigma factor [Microtetraspora malaysiensis]|uniref:RNA polymerase sigma factor n=1 Tax=Microtetraspora malaysiensis TaxID=161358 RepID=UPI003D940773
MTASTYEGSDSEVIDRSLQDPEGFAEIFRRHFHVIHRYASARLGPAAADDVAAETFLVAFRKRARYDLARHNARAWLFGIATNLIRRHRREEIRLYRALERTSVVPDGSPDDHQQRLAAALAVLKAADREVLLMVVYGELSYDQVSDALGIPVGTVGSRLNRARKRVREILNVEGGSTHG